jgi:hypothetical protein
MCQSRFAFRTTFAIATNRLVHLAPFIIKLMEFGQVDPAAFVLALLALLIAVESLLTPIRAYVDERTGYLGNQIMDALGLIADEDSTLSPYVGRVYMDMVLNNGRLGYEHIFQELYFDHWYMFGVWFAINVKGTQSNIIMALGWILGVIVWTITRPVVKIRTSKHLEWQSAFPEREADVILDMIYPTDTSRVVHDVIHISLMLAAILCSKSTIQSETWDEIG